MKRVEESFSLLVKSFVLFTMSVATSQSYGATLVWNANPEPDIAGYRVFYGETNTSPTRVDVGKTTSFPLPALPAGRTYFFYATAYNSAGLESSPSSQILYSPAATTGTATVSWEASTIQQLRNYNFYYGPTNSSPQRINAGLSRSISVSNLTSSVTYRFYVAAVNSANIEEQIYPEVLRTISTGGNNITLTRPIPAPGGSYIGRDAITQGSWKTIYGEGGLQIPGDSTQLPQFTTVSLNPNTPFTWASNVTDRAALERAASTNRIASAWYASNRVDLSVNFQDPYTHRVSLYFLDYDLQNRRQTVELRAAASGQLLQSTVVSNFQSGVFVSWNIAGNVTFRVLPGTAAPAVVSAVFFGSPAAGPNQPPTISNIPDKTIAWNSSSGPIAFQIADPDYPASRLVVTGSSSNPNLVPQGNIVLSGTSGTRQVTITPAANQVGPATIRVAVTDGEFVAEDSFVLNVVNQVPTISAIADQTIDEDTSTTSLGFTVGDAETPAGNLIVTASSSNTSMVPTTAILLGGSGANRTVNVTPRANQSGSATITLTVNDGMMTQVETFLVTVRPVNDAPTISILRDRTIPPTSSTGPIKFTIKDPETSAGKLTVQARSSNQLLIPNSGVTLSGTGGTRNITVTPLPLLTGSSVITVTVSDGSLTSTETFDVNVVPGAPTYTLNEGFEPTGYENSGWFEVGTPNENYATAALADRESLRCNGGQQVYRTLNSATSLHLYTQVRWLTWNSNHTIVDLMDTSGEAAGFIWADANKTLAAYHGDTSAAGTTILRTGVTYHVWLDWTAGPSGNGTMAIYVSETATRPAQPEASLNIGTGNALSRVYFGSPSTGPSLLFDNVIMDDASIGSNPGE